MQVNLLCQQPCEDVFQCYTIVLKSKLVSELSLEWGSAPFNTEGRLKNARKTESDVYVCVCSCVCGESGMDGGQESGRSDSEEFGKKKWGLRKGQRGGERRERKIWRVLSERRRRRERDGGGERVRGRCVERGVWEKSICSLERLEETISPVWPSSPLGVSMCVYVCVQVHACVWLCVYMCFNSQMPVCVCKRHACTLILSCRYVQPGMCG